MLKQEIHIQDTISKHLINCEGHNLKKFYDVQNYAHDNFLNLTKTDEDLCFTCQGYEIELKEKVKSFTVFDGSIILKEKNNMVSGNLNGDKKSTGHSFQGNVINYQVYANDF